MKVTSEDLQRVVRKRQAQAARQLDARRPVKVAARAKAGEASIALGGKTVRFKDAGARTVTLKLSDSARDGARRAAPCEGHGHGDGERRRRPDGEGDRHAHAAVAMLIDAVEWLGHSGFRVTGRAARRSTSTPTGSPTARARADLILVTHGHYDHFSPRDIQALSDGSTWLIAPAAVAERVGGRVLSIAPGEVVEPELRARRRRPRGRRLQHVEARRGRQPLPRARGRLGGLRPERPRRAALPRGRHRRDPGDGPGRGRRRGAAARQRDLRDDRRGGRRGRAADPAAARGADALGPAHRHRGGRAAVRRA